jgi:hypothetical protein
MIYDSEEYGDAIEIRHRCSNKSILLRPCDANKKLWMKMLVKFSSQNLNSNPDFKKDNCNGKVRITICSLVGVKIAKPSASTIKAHMFVRVTLQPFTYRTYILP